MLSENNGPYKFINILDDNQRMQDIYEKFIFRFYKYILTTYKIHWKRKIISLSFNLTKYTIML